MSVWPGARWVPGGHSTFFGLCNTFVHFFMYLYYMMAALGPQYQKYIWWKRHMTNLQMIQFIAIFIHGSQLLIQNDCNYPTAFGYFIAAHAVLFFILFAQFYLREYLDRGKSRQRIKVCASRPFPIFAKYCDVTVPHREGVSKFLFNRGRASKSAYNDLLHFL